MVFRKYIKKISNAVGTVNYLQNQTKERQKSLQYRLYDGGYDCVDYVPAMVPDMDSDGSAGSSSEQHFVLSSAMAELRNTLFFYPLVFRLVCCFLLLLHVLLLLLHVVLIVILQSKASHSTEQFIQKGTDQPFATSKSLKYWILSANTIYDSSFTDRRWCLSSSNIGSDGDFVRQLNIMFLFFFSFSPLVRFRGRFLSR